MQGRTSCSVETEGKEKKKVTRGGSSVVRTVRVQVIISVGNDGVSSSNESGERRRVFCYRGRPSFSIDIHNECVYDSAAPKSWRARTTAETRLHRNVSENTIECVLCYLVATQAGVVNIYFA